MNALPPAKISKRVLVVEDERPTREVLEIALANGGYQVVTASDGREALNLARLMHFDLVITDMIMPCKEGIGTIMNLLAFSPEIKIIAMSDRLPGDKGDFLPLAKSLGASAVLRKPFDREHLIATVRNCMIHANDGTGEPLAPQFHRVPATAICKV